MNARDRSLISAATAVVAVTRYRWTCNVAGCTLNRAPSASYPNRADAQRDADAHTIAGHDGAGRSRQLPPRIGVSL